MTASKTPKLRFKDENGKDFQEWYKTDIDKISKSFNNKRIPISKEKRSSGIYPYYGANGVVDYIYDYILEGNYVLLAEDGVVDTTKYPVHFVSGKFWVNNHAHILKGTLTTDKFLFYLLVNTKFSKYITGSAQTKLNSDVLKKIVVKIPEMEEQKKISEFLTTVDNYIQNLKSQKEELEKYKKAVMQKIFSQQLRFKDANGKDFPDWERRKLSQVLHEHRNKSTGNEEVHSVSVHRGVINQIEHLGRVFAANNTSKYNLVYPNDVIYTKSPTGDFPFGIIKQNKLNKNVIVSPLYAVFTPETEYLGHILDTYFESNLNTSNYLSSIIQKGAKNTINITNNTFTSKKLFLPVSKMEQKKISDFLKSVENLTENKNKEIVLAEQWKKGLMQQMFI